MVTGSNNRRLLTDKLTWVDKKKRFESDVDVKVESSDTILTGTGLISKADLSNIEVLENVQVESQDNKGANLF